MRGYIGKLVDQLFDRLAVRIAKRTVQDFFFFELHPSTLLFRETQIEAAAYVKEKMPEVLYFMDRLHLLAYAVERISIPSLVLEFGVFQGKSIRIIAARTNRPVHGFDSFEGLPEDWVGNKSPRGAFSTGGELPSVPKHVTLHEGTFEETLPKFLREKSEDVALAHIDCDLYSSAKTVLENIAPHLREGTVLVFDDYFNFPGWRNHEYRAFQELVQNKGIRYEYIAYGRHQVALVIKALGQ